jgi:hypothetical protein
MSSNEYVKFLTRTLVNYMETPKSVRKEKRAVKKESWSYRWFGMIPLSISMLFKKQR